MPAWILHCHLGRRRVELPDLPCRADVLAALERVSPRPGWADGFEMLAEPQLGNATRIRCKSPTGETLGVFKRSNARSPNKSISVYLPPDVLEQFRAEADRQNLTMSELAFRLIERGLKRPAKK